MTRKRSEINEFDFLIDQSVRWGDMDSMGHVNNGVYFTYAEGARIAFLDNLLGSQGGNEGGQGPILAHTACDFHEQLHYPADLQVGVRVEKVGRSSATLRCPVFRRGQERAVADVRAIIVWFDYQTQQAIPLPEELRELAP